MNQKKKFDFRKTLLGIGLIFVLAAAFLINQKVSLKNDDKDQNKKVESLENISGENKIAGEEKCENKNNDSLFVGCSGFF